LTVDPKKNGDNWYAYCNDNPLRFIDLDGFKPRDCSSILNKDKYHTIDDGRKGLDSFMTFSGLIPGPNTVLSTLYGFSRMNEKINPYVVIFTERAAFLKEAGARLNKINDKINALLNKDTLTKKDASQLHKLQTEQERLRNEIKVNKDADKKDIERINKDLEEWVGPGSVYNDDRSDDISDTYDDNDDDDID
jgi:hypothetical protein